MNKQYIIISYPFCLVFQKSNEGVWHFHGGGKIGDLLPAAEMTCRVSGSTRFPKSSASTFSNAREAERKIEKRLVSSRQNLL